MANRKISDLTALTATAVGDLLPIVDISEAAAADKNKKITLGTLLGGAPLGSAAAPTFAFTGDSNTGIYSPGADQLAIATAGTGRVFVDGSGNLGLEVTPSAWSTGKALEFTSGAWYSSSASIQDLCHNTYFNGTYYYKNTNGAVIYRQSGSQHAWFNAPSGTANTVAPFTQAMTLDASGRLLVGQTGTGLQAARSMAWQGSGEGTLYLSHSTSDTNGDAFVKFGYNAGQIGSITQNGTTAVAYNTSSDYRLKENVTPVPNGITRLLQLKPSRFNFIADPDRTVDGFIAHEVQATVPEAITGEKDAVDDDGKPVYQGIDQSKLVPLLTAALQEAIARIETLETEVAALKGA